MNVVDVNAAGVTNANGIRFEFTSVSVVETVPPLAIVTVFESFTFLAKIQLLALFFKLR